MFYSIAVVNRRLAGYAVKAASKSFLTPDPGGGFYTPRAFMPLNEYWKLIGSATP
jgi:hypothetical protein